MMERKKLDHDSLRAMSVPKLLADELVALDALCLDRPAPTDELVRGTMERCEEALKEFQPAQVKASQSFPRRDEETVPAFAELLGALNTCVAARTVSFAYENPKEPALIVVDNHEVIDAGLWGSDPSLQMLDGTYRGVECALERITHKPLDRLIVLKEDVGTYDERGLDAIRKSIRQSAGRGTYLVAAKDAGPFKECGYAVVAQEMVFEFKKGDRPNSLVVKAAEGVCNPEKAKEVDLNFFELKKKAFPVYVNNTLNSKLADALRTTSNGPLLVVLRDISRGVWACAKTFP